MIHTDHNKNNTTLSNLKNGHQFQKSILGNIKLLDKKILWDSVFPVPDYLLPWAPLIIFTLALACFINSIYGNFVFDDSEAIVNNNDLKLETPLSNIFKNDFWGTKLTHNNSHKSYRPLTVLTFRINNFLSGGLHPVSFHLVNVVLYGIVCILTFYVICSVFIGIFKHHNAPKASFICALLFTVHPVHTESVSAVVGRADLLCALFFFLSFLAYVKGCKKAIEVNIASSFTWIGICLILAGISMLCKEQGITVIGICSAYDIIINCKIDLSLISLLNLSTYKNQKWLSQFLGRQIFLTVGGMILLFGRWQIMGARAPVFQHVDNPASFEENLILRVINYNYIYTLNIWILLHPLWLCFDWSMGCVPLIRSASDFRLIVVIIFWAVFGLFFYFGVLSGDRKIRRLTTMGLAFLIVPFLPASNIFFRVGFVIAERALFLPSLGICFLITIGFHQICNSSNQQMNIICFSVLIATYVGRSIQRSSDWRNEELLFKTGLDVCPLNAKSPRPDFAAAWMNLGIVQSSKGKVIEAEQSYLTAINHRKHYPDCYYNLGNLYLEQKQYEKAYLAWKNATTLQPNHLVAWNNMIIMLDSIGSLLKAEAMAQEALEILPNEASLHFNLANTLGKVGRYHESEKHFQKAIALNSNNPTYYTNLGVLYHRWKKYKNAEEAYLRALELKSDMKSARENLELLYRTINKINA
ncbi:transmembrane and TPR repeat-containing protein 4-like [Centruroides sculpturatus]|uniref:transmembrane and TPR repeat-containing protein 4-like n=1 Tax=Centruroides sculpturatus TaxID=218467 RepID=UPI000C6D7330|nr:transmembrane and TPR repeat-containing protein 4-like [Centruroides sculpturatus]